MLGDDAPAAEEKAPPKKPAAKAKKEQKAAKANDEPLSGKVLKKIVFIEKLFSISRKKITCKMSRT